MNPLLFLDNSQMPSDADLVAVSARRRELKVFQTHDRRVGSHQSFFGKISPRSALSLFSYPLKRDLPA
jgi:hypothetical protein